MFRIQGNAPLGPFSEGEKTDPAAATLMADTGALPAGLYEFVVTVGGSAAAQFLLQRRNAANSGNVVTLVLYGSTQSGQYRVLTKLELNERLRVVMDNDMTGVACAGLNGEPMA